MPTELLVVKSVGCKIRAPLKEVLDGLRRDAVARADVGLGEFEAMQISVVVCVTGEYLCEGECGVCVFE